MRASMRALSAWLSRRDVFWYFCHALFTKSSDCSDGSWAQALKKSVMRIPLGFSTCWNRSIAFCGTSLSMYPTRAIVFSWTIEKSKRNGYPSSSHHTSMVLCSIVDWIRFLHSRCHHVSLKRLVGNWMQGYREEMCFGTSSRCSSRSSAIPQMVLEHKPWIKVWSELHQVCLLLWKPQPLSLASRFRCILNTI